MGCLILRTTVPPEPRSTEGTDHLLRLSTPRFMKWVGVPLTAEPPSTFVVVWRRTRWGASLRRLQPLVTTASPTRRKGLVTA